MKATLTVYSAALMTIVLFSSHAQEATTNASVYPVPGVIRKPEEIRFKQSSFTFVRIRYSSPGRRGASSWATDFPDADRNFSRRFEKVTGLRSDTNGMVLELTDPRLTQQPFIYLAEGGQMQMTPAEVQALRAYLLDGGFLMVDDFWGDLEWESLADQFRRVFPDREPIELPLEHPIFHSFYALHAKPQVPPVGAAGWRTGVTSDRPDAKEAQYRGLVGANGRLMVVFCHNTDLADGWEEEATDPVYFEEFSQKRAYPMGINIVVYALSQ